MNPLDPFEARRAHLISLHTAGGWDLVARWTLEPKWQPIETQKKEDGVPILLWDGSEVFEGFWHAFRDLWATSYGDAAHPKPTHWQPLPEPPKEPT